MSESHPSKAATGQCCTVQTPHRVKGLKALQGTSIYIVSVIFAFLIYHMEKHSTFNNLHKHLCTCVSEKWQ